MNKWARPEWYVARDTRRWAERVMNMTVIGLYAGLNGDRAFWLERCWYIVGEGTTMKRESDGRSPVEPVVPGDYHGPHH